MKLVNAEQMRELEQRADASGNSYAQMMERAGTLVAQAMIERWSVRDKTILILVGPGNNGGDGLVCARVLHDAGASVQLYVWKRALDLNDANWKLCADRNIPFIHVKDDSDFSQLREKISGADFVLDALLGTGVSRSIEGTLKALLETIQASIQRSEQRVSLLQTPDRVPSSGRRPILVAIDLPTGLVPDTGALDPATIPADLTVTFAFPKMGQYLFPGANAVGELVIADIGIPGEWADEISIDVVTANEIRGLLPKRARDSNKGTFGKTMIACGSLNYTGAPVLAARAAGRSGTGLVTLAIPLTIHAVIAAKIDEATFLPLPDHAGDWRPRSANELLAALWDSPYDALLVGCGIGRAFSTSQYLERLLEQLHTLENPPTLVLDADALNLLAGVAEWWTRFEFAAPPILTPHPGEMARLLGTSTNDVQSDRLDIARRAAQGWNAVVVLKGAFTVIASPTGNVTILPFANSALATAGTGDVLAGTIAGIRAQYHAAGERAAKFAEQRLGERRDEGQVLKDSYNAAVVGAYLHAMAGEIAAQEIGRAGIVAGDLVTRLPQAITRLRAMGNE